MDQRSRSREAGDRRARRRRGRIRLAGVVLVLLCAGLLALHSFQASDADTVAGTVAHTDDVASAGTTTGSPPPTRLALRVTHLTRLAAPVQDPAVTSVGSRAYAFGGLDAAGASTATILVLQGSSIRTAGRLPVAIHDAAAATVAGRPIYVMGGGQVASVSGIGNFNPANGRTQPDWCAAHAALGPGGGHYLGRTTYVVGGYTGAQWSDHIYALRWPPRARLPAGFRRASATPLSRRCPVQPDHRRRSHRIRAQPRDLPVSPATARSPRSAGFRRH